MSSMLWDHLKIKLVLRVSRHIHLASFYDLVGSQVAAVRKKCLGKEHKTSVDHLWGKDSKKQLMGRDTNVCVSLELLSRTC